MGLETIFLVFGVILVVAIVMAFRGRRRPSPTEPVQRGDPPPRSP